MKCDVYNSFLFRFNDIFILSISSASLFKSSNTRFSSMIMEFNNCFLSLLLINVLPFYYLPHLSISINKKIITIVPNLKQKCLSKLIFFSVLFLKFKNKKNYLIYSHPFLFAFFFLSTINKFICFRKCTSNSIQDS